MIKMFFGSPGCGKSTLAVYFAKIFHRKYDHIYSNFPVSLSYVSYISDFSNCGKTYVLPPNSLILLDEAGIDYNNRKYKSLSDSQISFFKLHRHYKCDIFLFSQSWEDVDVTLRRLTTDLWHIRKFGPFSYARRVKKFVSINEETSQIVDGYDFEPIWKFLFFTRVRMCIFRPLYYKYFDSYSVDTSLPIRM